MLIIIKFVTARARSAADTEDEPPRWRRHAPREALGSRNQSSFPWHASWVSRPLANHHKSPRPAATSTGITATARWRGRRRRRGGGARRRPGCPPERPPTTSPAPRFPRSSGLICYRAFRRTPCVHSRSLASETLHSNLHRLAMGDAVQERRSSPADSQLLESVVIGGQLLRDFY